VTDRRTHPANERVAHDSLRGQIHGVTFTAGTRKTISSCTVDISTERPNGPRDREKLCGEAVNVLEETKDFAFVVCEDGYVGYTHPAFLSDFVPVTHRVATLATHAYADEDFKSQMVRHLPFAAKLQVLDERRKFYETNWGFIPKKHLRPLDRPFDDPATIAQLHFNVPYLWGGNSTLGIDCSGLIQAALTACDIPCPGDSDMQCAQLGADIPEGAALQRTDLIFWKGHVGMMVDGETLIHANAHHMACRYEPLEAATLRIKAQGDGPVIARKRIS
jgi:hypothetical protein